MSVEDLDSFDIDMSLFGEKNNDEEDFRESVSQITFPPTLYQILINSGKFTREQLEELNDIVQNKKSPGVGVLRDAMMQYVEAVNADSSNIEKKQEKLSNDIKKALFPEKKGGRKKRRKRKTRRKSKKRKRKTKRKTKKRRKKRKTKRGGAHKWGNYADFYNYLKEIDEKHEAETGEEDGSLGAPYTFRYIDSGTVETEALAQKEAYGDGTYIFTFWINSDDPELQMTHDFDSGDILDDEEPYEEVQFKIPLLWRPEPEGGGRKKKRKTKKRRR